MPGGGIVFYENPNYESDGWRYLEAAPVDQGVLMWASSGFGGTYLPGTETAIGTGKANIAAILGVDANPPAAKACKDYNGGDKDDWFLPSKDELYEMYKARNHLGISTGSFWSSSQNDDYHVYDRVFDDGTQYNQSKGNVNNVSAIRRF